MPLTARALALAALSGAALSGAALAEETTIAAPIPGTGSYDPTLSAKEAVLANWELAASGILAGHVVGRQVVALADKDVPYAHVVRQAEFAEKTILQRYNSAAWIYAAEKDVAQVGDATLRAVVLAVAAECAAEACPEERAAIRAAFAQASDDMGVAADSVRAAIDNRQDRGDAVLMAEQLGVIADYLESRDWAENLTLADFERDSEEVSARIVGAMALWKNVEPYVGLTNQEIDNAVNDASRNLLRTLRYITRDSATIDPEGEEMERLKAASQALAVEFRRAAALFAV